MVSDIHNQLQLKWPFKTLLLSPFEALLSALRVRLCWQSVVNLSKRLVDCRRVLIIGNGGIALELVQALTSAQTCQVLPGADDCIYIV